jgi:hypothetical protein
MRLVNGLEHWREADRLLTGAKASAHPVEQRIVVEWAHVHATLALAAATALRTCGMGDTDRHAWHDACAGEPT